MVDQKKLRNLVILISIFFFGLGMYLMSLSLNNDKQEAAEKKAQQEAIQMQKNDQSPASIPN